MLKSNLEQKRMEIVDFIKMNPKATYKLIREKLKTHPERFFKSLEEAYFSARIIPPRSFKIKTLDEKRNIIMDYIRNHPQTGLHTIRKDTKINLLAIFKSIKEAYKEAGIKYPREESYKKSANEKKREIIRIIKEHPQIAIDELMKKVRTNPYRFYNSIGEIYKAAGIKRISGNNKRRSKKQIKVLDFIKKNPIATQREINNACNTHVQLIFKRGIFEAYEKAGVIFPYQRLKKYGVGLKQIRLRATSFEDKIATMLSGYGNVSRLVKTKRGFADIILERKNKKAIIEVKDYEAKDISISQVKQLNRYLEDCNCDLGFLVCFKKPKKDSFLIGKNRIFLLDKTELHKVPGMMGSVV